MKVYFATYDGEPVSSAMFCRKKYWEKNKAIEDGFSEKYDRLSEAFESVGVEVVGDGEVEWEDLTPKQIKKALKEKGIELLINDETFIEEFENKYGSINNTKDEEYDR